MSFFGSTNVCVGGSVKAIVDGHEVKAVITSVTPPMQTGEGRCLRFPVARRFELPAEVDGFRTYTFGDQSFRISERVPIVEPLPWVPPGDRASAYEGHVNKTNVGWAAGNVAWLAKCYGVRQ